MATNNQTGTIDKETQVRNNLSKIEKNILKKQEQETEIQDKLTFTKEKYSDTKKQLKKQCDVAIKEVEEECNKMIESIDEKYQQEENKIQTAEREIQDEIDDLQKLVNNISITEVLEQDGLRQKRAQEADKTLIVCELAVKQPIYKAAGNLDVSSLLGKINYSGDFKYEVRKSCNGRVVIGYRNILEAKNMELVTSVDVKGKPWRIGLVNGKLWIPGFKNAVNISKPDDIINGGKFKKTEIGVNNIYDVVQVNETDVVVTGSQGIFVLTPEGEKNYKVTDGKYGCISTDGMTVVVASGNYKAGIKDDAVENDADKDDAVKDNAVKDNADENDKADDDDTVEVDAVEDNEVVILKQVDNKWQIICKFKIDKNIHNKTVHLDNNSIYVGGEEQRIIKQYNIDGKFVKDFNNEETSEKLFFRICGSDSQGSVVCCSQKSHGIFILSTSTGKWHSFYPMLGLVGRSRERDVCVMGDHVYVLHGYYGQCKISVFKI